MSIPRAIEGARYTGVSLTWQDEDGNAQDLTGFTLSGTIKDKDGTSTAIAGTLTPDADQSTNPGLFAWAFAAADIATPGRYTVQFKKTQSGQYDLSFPEAWVVEPAQ